MPKQNIKGRAFLVVGHKHWGKSRTIRALTNEYYGWVKLEGKWFFVRLMSNDDKPEGYGKFIKHLDPAEKPLVIIAYCPEDESPEFLSMLAKKYDVFLWVLRHNYRQTEEILPSTIAKLRSSGTVEYYQEKREDS